MNRNKANDKRPIRDLLKEKDAFLTTSEKLLEFSLRHTKALIGGAVIVIALFLAVLAFNHGQQSAEQTAADSLEQALASPTRSQAIEALEKVRADFPAREAARLAALSLVGFYAETGAYEKALSLAENMLQTLKPAEKSLRPLLLDNLGGLHETMKNYPLAVQNYQALLDWPALDDNFRQSALLALGRVQAAAGDREAAAKAYQRLLREYPNSYRTYLAQASLAALTD